MEAQTVAEKITQAVQTEFEKAKTPDEKKKVSEKYVNDAKKSLETAKEIRNEMKAKNNEIPGDSKSDAEDLDVKIRRILEEEVLNNSDKIPPAAKVVLTNLSEQNLSYKQRMFLSPVIIRLATDPNYLQFTAKTATGTTDFETDLHELFLYNDLAAQKLKVALHEAVLQKKLTITRDELDTKLDEIKKEEETKKTEFKKKVEKAEKENKSKAEKMADTDRQNILWYFSDKESPEEKRLIDAVYGTADTYWEYMRGILYGAQKNPAEQMKPDGVIVQAEKEINEEIDRKAQKGQARPNENTIKEMKHQRAFELMSDEFMNRSRRLIGQLYMRLDESNPRETSQTAMQSGGIYRNLKSVTDSYFERFLTMKKYSIPDDLQNNIRFYRLKQEEITIDRKTKSREDVDFRATQVYVDTKTNRAEKIMPHTYLNPHFVTAEIHSFADYMQYVHNAAKTEVGLRRFLHDARALPYLETGQQSYWQQLAGFARQYLDTSDMDNIHTLFDADEIMNVSRTWDKLNELAFARNDWIYKTLTDIPDPDTQHTDIDQATRDYMKLLYGKMTDWERNRVIAAGIADNYGVTLRALTTNSMADPALKPDGSPSMQSYGPKDAALYEVFNYMAHVMGRWDSEGANLGGLMWLPIEGEDLRDFSNTWDYRKLLTEMNKAKAAFIAGRNPDDIKNKRLRFADIVNLGRVGSIYDRAGWRQYYAYEGWLKEKDVLSSVKAMENIGIEAMRNFLSSDVATVDSSFYNDGSENKRKELVTYLYKKYFVQPEAPHTDEEVTREVDKIFAELEIDKPDMKKMKNGYAPKQKKADGYSDFYYRTLARAVAQRLPTKFLRIESERTRKTNGLRKRAYEDVFDLSIAEGINIGIKSDSEWARLKAKGSKPDKEAYYQALQDICAFGESLLRREATEKIKNGLKDNDGQLYSISLEDYNLTPEKMQQLWNKYEIKFDDKNAEIDAARRQNALAVLKASRKYVFDQTPKGGEENPYLDEFADRWGMGPPHGPPFAIAVEEMERSLLAHRAAGANANFRALSDIVEIDQVVMKEVGAFYSTLRKVAIGKDHKFDDIIGHIAKARSVLSTMHGTNEANQFVQWMSKIAIAFFKKNTEAENMWSNLPTAIKTSGQHHSLASFITNARPGEVWEWDRQTIRDFIDQMALRRMMPYQPYKSQKNPKYVDVFKVNKDGKDFERDASGNLNKAAKQQREQDYNYFAEQLVDQFLNNPAVDMLQKITPILLLLLLSMLVSNAVKGYKFASGEK